MGELLRRRAMMAAGKHETTFTTVTWSGSGTQKNATPVIDARNCEVFFTLPFVEGASELSPSATEETLWCKWKTNLYNDEEMTDFVGFYWWDSETITASDRTWSNCPKIAFNQRVKVAPKGYYARLRFDKNSGFTSNGTCTSYLNAYGSSVELVT